MNLSTIFNNLDFRALKIGASFLIVLSGLFYFVEYGIFMILLSKTGKGFIQGGREVVESIEFISIVFTIIFMKFGISTLVVAFNVKNSVVKNCLFLHVPSVIVLKATAFVLNSQDFKEYVWLNLAEVIWALAVCLGVSWVYAKVR